MPLLRTEDGSVLFESQPIVEYLDETVPGARLAPENAVERAHDRAWFTYASEELFGRSYRMESTNNDEVFDTTLAEIRERLDRLEPVLAGRDWLSGDGSRFGLADVAFAQLFTRFAHHKAQFGVDVIGDRPNLAAWMERTLARPSVQHSTPDVWATDMGRYMEHYGAVIRTKAA